MSGKSKINKTDVEKAIDEVLGGIIDTVIEEKLKFSRSVDAQNRYIRRVIEHMEKHQKLMSNDIERAKQFADEIITERAIKKERNP